MDTQTAGQRTQKRIIRFATLCAALSLSSQAIADVENAELQAELLRQLSALIGPFSAQEQLVAVAPPAVVESVTSLKPTPPDWLKRFAFVPAASTDQFVPTTLLIHDALNRLDERIELVSPSLTSAQEAELEDARKLLFTDYENREESQTYVTYKTFAARREALQERLKNPANVAERAGTTAELTRLNREWLAFGFKVQVENALATITRLDEDVATEHRADWQRIIQEKPALGDAQLWRALASPRGWNALSFRFESSEGRQLRLRSPSVNVVLPGAIDISCKLVVVRLPRPEIQAPFLRLPTWRNDEGYVVSDGLSTDSSAELVPRVATAFVIIKDIELRFADAKAWETVMLGIPSKQVSLGGIPLNSGGALRPFHSPSYVALAQPLVVAVVLSSLPKIPNTEPSADWPILRW